MCKSRCVCIIKSKYMYIHIHLLRQTLFAMTFTHCLYCSYKCRLGIHLSLQIEGLYTAESCYMSYMISATDKSIYKGLSYIHTKDLYLVITLNLINLHVKSTALFTFCCAFHSKALCFSLFAVLFTEKHKNN